jgi:hypothetical protein
VSRAERVPVRAVAPAADPGGVLGAARSRSLGALTGSRTGPRDMIAVSEAGVGKSALLDAVAAELAGWRCLRVRARRDEQGAPFAVVRALAAAAADGAATLTDASPVDRAAQLFDALVLPAGEDPVVQGDRVVLAWLDYLEALTTAGPLALLVDDADRADLSSLRLLDRALVHLAARPFALVITQAPGRPVALGDGLEPTQVVAIRIGPLGPRACGRLVRRWAPGCGGDDEARVVRAAAGNPMHLRELCRDLARAGADAPPRSVAELLWARLVELPAETRRALRAASIIGRELWLAAVELLLGAPAGDPVVARHCDALIGAGYLRATPSRIQGHAQLEFTSELAYLAAYELTDATERRAGTRDRRLARRHAPGRYCARATDAAGARDRPPAHCRAPRQPAATPSCLPIQRRDRRRAARRAWRVAGAARAGPVLARLERRGRASARPRCRSAPRRGSAPASRSPAPGSSATTRRCWRSPAVAARRRARTCVAAERRVVCRALSQLGPERTASLRCARSSTRWRRRRSAPRGGPGASARCRKGGPRPASTRRSTASSPPTAPTSSRAICARRR